jgi:hypothetical protein
MQHAEGLDMPRINRHRGTQEIRPGLQQFDPEQASQGVAIKRREARRIDRAFPNRQ